MEESIYRLRWRDILTLCVVALLFLGVIMVQSASMHMTGNIGWRWSDTGLKHVRFVAVALGAFWVLGHLNYRFLVRQGKLKNLVLWLVLAATCACVLVLVPHIGRAYNGARRWLPLAPGVVLQPSELGKWAVVFFLAWWLSRPQTRLNSFFLGFVPALAPAGLICLLVVIQDFGTAALIMLCALAMCFVGRVRWRHLIIVVPPVMAVAFWFVRHKEYRWKRMTAFLDPYAAPQREGYHMIQSLLSFSTGGIFGRGLGNGIQKLGYLPEDTTDFIFAVICEELGLFGALLTIALYLGILFVAWQAIKQQRDKFGRMLAFGIAAMIGFQALINMAVATVSVPTKGLSLPLVSAGGSGLVITCAALGILYSVCRYDNLPPE